MSPYQFGFLPNRSTSSALLFATNSFHKILQNNKAICACFLDLKKAFDTVPHAPLIDLLSSLNCPPSLLKWSHSYLSSRSQQVVLNGSSSSSLPVLSGVPQRSILGPILFLIYINGITSIPLSPSSTLILYADDILIFRPIDNELDLSTFQNDLNSISLWLSTNFLSLNPSKSKYMFLSYRRSIFINSLPPLCLSGSPLELVTEFKYLGVTISSLSWSPHISNICAKARKLLDLLYRQLYFYSDTSTLLHLYISLIRPHLEYCSFLLDPHSSHFSSKIEKVQHFACNICSKDWSSDYTFLLSKLQLPTRRQNAKLIFLFKILHNLVDFFHPLLQFQPVPSYNLRVSYSQDLQYITYKTQSALNSFFTNLIKLYIYINPVNETE